MKINKILILELIIIILFTINNYAYISNYDLNYEINEDGGELYIVRLGNVPNFKLCVVNDKSEIVYKSVYDEVVLIIKDDYSKKPSLIKVDRIGEKINNDNSDSDTYTENSERLLYFDKNGQLIDMGDDDIDINFIYNDYAIDNKIVLSDDELTIYDLKNKRYINNDIGLSEITFINNHLFGKKIIKNDKDIFYKYFLLNNDMSINKEITIDEYVDLQGIKFHDYIYTDNDIIFGVKHNLKYILDKHYELLSDGYDCDYIGIANFQQSKPLDYKYNYKDIIFYRIKQNTITYFTLEKELYTKDIIDEWTTNGKTDNPIYKNNKIFNRRYSEDETFVVGENNCYAILNDDVALVFSLENDSPIATLSSIVDNRNNEYIDDKYRNIFYIDNIYRYGNYVLCIYYDNVSETYYDYVNINNGFNANVLNKDLINISSPKQFVVNYKDNAYKDHRVIDIEKGKRVKFLYNKYVDMKVFEYDNKYIIALKKENTIDDNYEFYDLYDNYYNLLYANVTNIVKYYHLLSFDTYKFNDKVNEYNKEKIYNNYTTIINFDYEKLFESNYNNLNGIKYSLNTPGYKSEKVYIVAAHYNDGKKEYEELLDEKKNKVLDLSHIKDHRFIDYGNEIIMFAHTLNDTYIYKLTNGKLDFVKRFKGYYTPESNDVLDEYDNDNYIKKLRQVKNENNGTYSLLDENFNIIGDGYKNLEFGSGYYYYRKGFKVYICDFNNDVKAVISYFNSFEDE